VNEHVLGAVGRLHEAKALREIEELHGASDAIHILHFQTAHSLKPSPRGTPARGGLSHWEKETAGGALNLIQNVRARSTLDRTGDAYMGAASRKSKRD
jgi:hypothetical protein